MSELGKAPAGLMRAAGTEVWWALALSWVAHNPLTGEWAVVFPLLNGVMTMEVREIGPDGTGSHLSGS